MKKTKFIRRGLIILLVLGGLAFLGWNIGFKKASVNNRISIYSDVILCVDYKNLRNTLLQNYLFDSTSNISTSIWNEIKSSGVTIPDYFIVFSCTQKAKNSFFSSFSIDDTSKFTNYLDSNLVQKDWVKFQLGTSQCIQSKERKISLVYDLHKSILCVQYGEINKDPSEEISQDILNGTNLYTRNSPLLKKFQASKNHGLIWFSQGKYIEKESFLKLNLEKGKLVLNGSLFFNSKYRFPEKPSSFYAVDSATSFLFIDAGYSHWIKEVFSDTRKEKFNKLTSINIDSLMSYSSPSLSFNLKGFFKTRDTIISYSYDDNFNSVEKKEVVFNSHPEVEILLPSKEGDMYQYLLRDSCVKIINNESVFVGYPLTKVIVTPKNGVVFHTRFPIESRLSSDSSFLNLCLDYSMLDTNWRKEIGLEIEMLQNKIVRLSALQKINETIVDGSIEFGRE